MKVVGIKQLKARLSEYVRLAEATEAVLVIERDEVVAELRPSRRQTPVADRLEDLLDALGATGGINRAALPKRRLELRSRGLGLPPEPRMRCSTSCARSDPDGAHGIQCRRLSRHFPSVAGDARARHDSCD